jgi:predicted nucleic acid-binding protein
MNKGLMIDDGILIDYLRGHMQAVRYLEKTKQPLMLSAVTIAGLAGCLRDGKEAAAFEDFLDAFETVPVTSDIAVKAGLMHRAYAGNYGLTMTDAIVAATADLLDCPLATLDRTQYPMLKRVVVPYRKK